MIKIFWNFIKINIKAAFFAIFLLVIILISNYIKFSFISKYDFIFISAISFQLFLLIFKIEKIKEFMVIIFFSFSSHANGII